MTRWYYRLCLFFGILWRQIEPRGCGIPDEYRILDAYLIRGRICLRLAWKIAGDVWRKR